MRRREKLITDVLVFVISIFAGIQITTSICYTFFHQHFMKCPNVTSNTQNQNIAKVPIEPFIEELGDFQFNPGPKKKLVLVGVMTSSQYFDTRDWAIRMTWLKSIPGDVVFFVGNSTDPAPPGMPLIRLNRVPDNVYPPQGKVFEMLKYLHENHADKYEYFIRADDDAFIKGQELGSLLKSLNSEEKIYMGHYGQGVPGEIGKLGMGKDYWFCIGGPGVIFSHRALTALAPNLDTCKDNTFTSHEDTELGRCVEKYLKIKCKSNRKVRAIFYQNYREVKGTFSHELGKKESHAFTLHPVKNSSFVIRLALHFKDDEIKWLKRKADSLRNELEMVKRGMASKQLERLSMPMMKYLHNIEYFNRKHEPKKASVKFWYDTGDDTAQWEHIEMESIYSMANIHQAPKQKLSVKKHDETVQNAVRALLNHYWEGVDNIKFKKFLRAYRYMSPIQGVQHLLQVYLLQRKTENGYYNGTFMASQRLLPLKFTEEVDLFKRHFDINTKYNNSNGGGQMKEINLIMPIAGKLEAFVRFTETLEKIFKRTLENLKVILVIYKDPEGAWVKQIAMMKRLASQYPSMKLEVTLLTGDFARGVALQHGMKNCSNDSLLLFIDIDMAITETFLHQVRVNTIYGKQVYFPIYFSQFDPESICYKPNCKNNHYLFGKDDGFWRYFSFGMVSIYKKDFLEVGGYDTKIEGWGKEDIDFYELCLRSNLTAIRAPDLSLIHIYHPKFCSHDLNDEQYKMCLDSKSGIFGSRHQEARAVYRLPEILNK
ncbi:chondroitin sulfate synthase 1-like [Octopus sinensis]|uniref:Hexosyltransferase n=1 Tax=Octopus sinensis TaxID=2607531 RepID=A0A6P7TS26_9MOLL|nr:chondroitin sulfate synthase 1-like [Octopus sinensis]